MPLSEFGSFALLAALLVAAATLGAPFEALSSPGEADVAMNHPASLPPTPDSVPEPLTPAEATLRQAKADLETLDHCLERGESAAPERAPGVAIQRLRTLYLLAIEDEERIAEADRFRLAFGREAVVPDSEGGAAVVEAYGGALEVLRAKHAFWPNTRMRHLRAGLSELDAAVERHPRAVEIRYLRLVSTAFLPGILGRSGTAREDLAVVAHLLPGTVEVFPARTFEAMAATVLELLVDGGKEPPPALVEARNRARSLDRPLAPACQGA